MEQAAKPILYADGRYHGQGREIFWLALKTGFLTLITLGIYRFWAKTRVRRYIWGSIDVEGARFEYTGTGLEKFLGFLIAVVFLAIYLGITQMLLFFFGVSLFVEPETPAEEAIQSLAGLITLVALIPVIQFAVYRARRYKLARTRWRGIRFGMDNAAWGFAFRALGYGLLTFLTLGLLLPLATFKLEKYMTDRSWFGDAQFEQNGSWTKLYPAMKHLLIGGAIMILAGILGASAGLSDADVASFGPIIAAGLLSVVGVVWLVVGYVYYGVHSFRYLTANKTLAKDITFEARPLTSTVILNYVLGSLAISAILGVGFAIVGLIFGGFLAASMAVVGPEALPEDPLAAVGMGAFAVTALGYLVVLVLAGALTMAMITQPILAHYINTITIVNVDAFRSVVQRVSDQGADAEGFADALDIGGAI